MSATFMSFSTAGLGPAERIRYWANSLKGACGHVHADAFGAKTLDGHFGYACLSRLQLCQVGFSRYRFSLPPSCVGAYPIINVLFQTQGTSVFEQDHRQIVIEPGDCLAFDVSRPYVITSEDFARQELVMIPKELVRQRGVPLELLPAQKLSSDRAAQVAHDLMLRILKELPTLPARTADGMADALLGLLLLPFSQALGESNRLTHSDELRWRVKRFIDAHLRDPNLSVERVSDALGYTTRYLHKVFQQERTTLNRYIWESRLERCRQELENAPDDDRSITDVAFSWGFSSSSHFSSLFKSHFGVSPSVLKAQSGKSI